MRRFWWRPRSSGRSRLNSRIFTSHGTQSGKKRIIYIKRNLMVEHIFNTVLKITVKLEVQSVAGRGGAKKLKFQKINQIL